MTYGIDSISFDVPKIQLPIAQLAVAQNINPLNSKMASIYCALKPHLRVKKSDFSHKTNAPWQGALETKNTNKTSAHYHKWIER